MKRYTDGGLTLEKGTVFSKSTKQKINTKSSTQTEIVRIEDILSQVLWTNYFIKTQEW